MSGQITDSGSAKQLSSLVAPLPASGSVVADANDDDEQSLLRVVMAAARVDDGRDWAEMESMSEMRSGVQENASILMRKRSGQRSARVERQMRAVVHGSRAEESSSIGGVSDEDNDDDGGMACDESAERQYARVVVDEGELATAVVSLCW